MARYRSGFREPRLRCCVSARIDIPFEMHRHWQKIEGQLRDCAEMTPEVAAEAVRALLKLESELRVWIHVNRLGVLA